MGDRVESFGKVNRHGHRSVWWFALIETQSHFVCERKEGCGGTVSFAETMLCGGEGKCV